jgi:hypothetical protein
MQASKVTTRMPTLRSRTTNAARRERIQRFNVFQAASDRARGDARHTRHRGDAAISRGLGFRRSEKPPLPFVEMRQHRRIALLERIFIDHPQGLRRERGRGLRIAQELAGVGGCPGPSLLAWNATRLFS